jgi:ammonia channel protein AmtB
MNSGDTAWMLMSTALVMLMLPGLALFYGGLVRAKNVLSTIMHSFFGLAIVTVVRQELYGSVEGAGASQRPRREIELQSSKP